MSRSLSSAPSADGDSAAVSSPTKPALVFYNYHSMTLSLAGVSNLFSLVKTGLPIVDVRFFFCCDVRKTAPNLVDHVALLPGTEIVHLHFVDAKQYEEAIGKKMVALDGTPGLLALVAENGNYETSLNILSKTGWEIFAFHPKNASPFGAIDQHFDLPALEMNKETKEDRTINSRVHTLNANLLELIERFSKFTTGEMTIDVKEEVKKIADEVKKVEVTKQADVIATEEKPKEVPKKWDNWDSDKPEIVEEMNIEGKEDGWGEPAKPAAGPVRTPFQQNTFEQPNRFEQLNYVDENDEVYSEDCAPQESHNPFEKKNPFASAERPQVTEKPNPFGGQGRVQTFDKPNPFGQDRLQPYDKPNPFASSRSPFEKPNPFFSGNDGPYEKVNPFVPERPNPFNNGGFRQQKRNPFSSSGSSEISPTCIPGNERFRKPAPQCPHWEQIGHTGTACHLWHPRKPCLFYPTCRSQAANCGYAHPFCNDGECCCEPYARDPQLNHYSADQ